MRLGAAAALLAMIAGALPVCADNGAGQGADGRADAPPAAPGGDAALAAMTTDMVMQVFLRLCVAHPTREEARQRWLREHGFVEAPRRTAAFHLTAGPGSVWLRPDPPSVGFPLAVVTRPSGLRCEVRSPLADPERAGERFVRTVEGLATPGLVIRKDADDRTAPDGGPGRYVAFRVGAAPIERGGFLFAMSARPPEPGRIALLVTASPAAPE